jgi:hypothetical protein
MSACEGVVSDKILSAMDVASRALHDLGIPHKVIGGLAVGAWGHPRATRDVDFLVGKEAFDRYGSLVSFRVGVPIEVGGVRIDYLLPKESDEFLLDELDVSGGAISIGALIYMKLSAHRRKDLADVEELVLSGIDVEEVEQYLINVGSEDELKRFMRIIADVDADDNEGE